MTEEYHQLIGNNTYVALLNTFSEPVARVLSYLATAVVYYGNFALKASIIGFIINKFVYLGY